jgi:hypothetical protein
MRQRILLQVALLVLPIIFAPAAFAAISQKEARNAIAKTAGMSLPRSSVHTNRITSSTDSAAEVSADLDLAFRFEADQGRWRIHEIRVAEAMWEDVDLFVETLKLNLSPDSCDTKDNYQRVNAELSNRRARCLLADLFGVAMPSDAVRVKSIGGPGVGWRPSVLVVTVINANFRLQKDPKGWRVVEVRTGNRDWASVEGLPAAMDSLKRTRATDQMNEIAAALDAYRRERGSFVVSDKHHVLIDNLNPQFLHSVIRLDPWRHNYLYQGERDRFTLRSSGPDGKENTPDDLILQSR